MKNSIILSSLFVATLCGELHCLAQQSNGDASDHAEKERLHHLGKLVKASQIIGTQVQNLQNEKLGEVKDLAISLGNGRIVEVIVATGGFLGADKQYVAVPPEQFRSDAAGKTLQLNVNKEQLKNATAFKMSAWDENVSQANVEAVYQYYNTTLYYHQGNPSGMTNVERASKLLGVAVRNTRDEKIGKIENLVVDLPEGRVVEVVVASGGFLGMGDELSAVPPQSFSSGSKPDLLVLDVTKESLSRAPHFNSAQWPDANNPEHVSSVYRSYNVEPYFTTNAPDNTAQNVRDRQENTLTPLNQGSSAADVNTTRQIRRQIFSATDLSVNAHNVKIITVDGKVTLRGTVDSENEKREINDIAVKIASEGNVENQLQVKDSSDSVK